MPESHVMGTRQTRGFSTLSGFPPLEPVTCGERTVVPSRVVCSSRFSVPPFYPVMLGPLGNHRWAPKVGAPWVPDPRHHRVNRCVFRT